MDIRDRLLFLIRELRLNKKQFAESIEITPGNLGDWFNLNKKSLPSSAALRKIVKVHMVNLNWLINGEGEVFFKVVHPKKSKRITRYVRLPIVSPVSCGTPLEITEQEPEGYVYIDEDKLHANLKNYIGFLAEGDSMEPEIKDKDVVVLKLHSTWEDANDKIAAVRIYDEVTLKHVHVDHSKKLIILKPYNKDYDPIVIKERATKDTELIGIAIMSIRDLLK